jgi:hydroxyacylglutathione hydrolase
MLTVEIVPCLHDNYAYLLSSGEAVAVVDPSEAEPVLAALGVRQLDAILATHHHPDHVGGNLALRSRFPRAGVYGHLAEQSGERRIPGQTHGLADGEIFFPLGEKGPRAQALYVPGHTLTAVAIYFPDDQALFTGDTLFGAGCGRLFEGTPLQMHSSFARLRALPPTTRVYCGHEYTASNLRFAAAVEPHSQAIVERRRTVAAQQAAGLPTIPSTLGEELATNPFMRSDEPAVIAAATGRPAVAGDRLDAVEVFARLRRWKDNFVSPP